MSGGGLLSRPRCVSVMSSTAFCRFFSCFSCLFCFSFGSLAALGSCSSGTYSLLLISRVTSVIGVSGAFLPWSFGQGLSCVMGSKVSSGEIFSAIACRFRYLS